MPMQVRLNETHDQAILRFDDVLKAEGVESLIADLAVIRGQMVPEVPMEPDPNSNANVSVQSNPTCSLRLLRDGRIRFWIRNHGLGWLAFNLPVETACAIRDYLVANTPDVQNAPGFFDDETPDGSRSH